ncbi:ead/Ea22-like family protein [Salmonella enterica]|uniref:Ead/Ea22-like family protein n=2 Tax=Salmonella enterica TaxID=28901 RepID=A0A3R0XNT5_SALER|nr:ead/Ea22-like family protein [Salmonella enterica]
MNKQALREAAEKATKGPWSLFSDIDTKTFAIHTPRDKRCENVIKWGGFDCQPNAEANAEFIAAFNPKVALALLDENLQLQREKDAIEAVALALRDDMRNAREQLEAAERSMAEQSAIVAAAEKLVRCKGRYHSELNYRALAKLFGVITPDLPPLVHENVHYAEAVEVEISALRQRIQELEARVIVLPQRLSPEGYHIDEAYMVDDTEGEYLDRDAVIDAIRAAGIKVKG